MSKELEKAKQNLIQQLEDIKIANKCGIATKGEFNKDIQALETILNYIDNSIPKEVVEEKIETLKDTLDLLKADKKVAKYKILAIEMEIQDLQKLIKEE